MALFRRSSPLTESAAAQAHRCQLIDRLTFEVVPLKSLDDAVAALPPGAEVSVTCSPAKGIAETQRIASELVEAGFVAIPHIAGRMVRDRAHTAELAAWFRSAGISKAFVVAGDAEEPGRYEGAVEFLSELLETDHGLDTVGVAAYPDGHAFLTAQQVTDALFAKQTMLSEAGVAGYCTTQMCFDPATIGKWIRVQREHGMTLPVHLGISGVVDKTKLLTLGVRLGIGQSLSYLKKNRAAVAKMLTTTSYDPDDLLVPLSADLMDFGVEGLHVFTFNQVEATNTWRLSHR